MNEMIKGAITQDCPYSSKEGKYSQGKKFSWWYIFSFSNRRIISSSNFSALRV